MSICTDIVSICAPLFKSVSELCTIYIRYRNIFNDKGGAEVKKVKKKYTEENQSEQKNIYKKKIIEIVTTIDNPAIINSIYSFVMGILSAKEKQGTD